MSSFVGNYYDKQFYGGSHSDRWIKLPFSKQDYYGTPLQRLGCKAGDKLLDVACGDGDLLALAESLGLQCWGIDISQVAIDLARSRSKAALICADVNNGLPYDDKFFDQVTCLGSLEHFERQAYVLSEIHRVTKASGRIYILVSNGDYILYKVGYETDNQPVVNRYSLAGYRKLLTKNGLAIDCVLRDNSHLSNLAKSSSWPKLVLKLLVHPFVGLIPLRLSYNFIFICQPNVREKSREGNMIVPAL